MKFPQYHSLSLSEPLNTNVQEQSYSDDYLATVLFDNDRYLQTIDYYFWITMVINIYGVVDVSNTNSFDISGYCNEDSCMSSLKLYWKGSRVRFYNCLKPNELIIIILGALVKMPFFQLCLEHSNLYIVHIITTSTF